MDTTAALQRLLDRQEITGLLHAYARAVDRMDATLLRSVYTPDGTDDHGAFAGTADDYVTWVLGLVGSWVSTHHDISNVMLEFDGDDRAFGECHWTGWYVVPDGEGGLVDQVSCGRYLDRFERVEGRWGIAHRVCVSDWSRRAPRDSPPRDHRLAGRRGSDDLVHSLRLLRLPD